MQNRRANIPMREKKQRGPVSGSDVQIHAVKRFCAASDCSNEITGHSGQYCCHACYQRDYYRRHKKKIAKQRAARSVKRMLSPKSVENMSATPASSKKKPVPAAIPETKKQNNEEPLSTDMLSVSEAAKRLKVCRQTLYNLEASGTIRILHLTPRLSFIRWSDLLALFDDPKMCGKPVARPNKTLKTKRPVLERIKTEPGEWCDIGQACLRYNAQANAIYTTISRHKIPKKKNGKTTLYSTEHLDRARGYTKTKHLQGYITVNEASEKYHIPISTVYYKINRFGLKIIKHHSKTMFEEAAFRRHLKSV